MTDVRTREIEREASQGDMEAKIKHLRERVRAGTLTPGKLELAAYCGYEVAKEAIGWQTFYVVVNSGNAVFAKDGDFFVAQGGLTDDWGKNWVKVFAESNQASRIQAKFADWLKGLPAVDTGMREERCGRCAGDGREPYPTPDDEPAYLDKPCLTCKGTCIRRVPWGAYRLLLRAVNACAAVALPIWEANKSNQYHVIACPWSGQSNWLAAETLGDPFCLCEGDNRDLRPRRALKASQHYEEVGTLEALSAWRGTILVLVTHDIRPTWLPLPDDSLSVLYICVQYVARAMPVRCPRCKGSGGDVVECSQCKGSSRIPDEDAVRDTICADLIEWALC